MRKHNKEEIISFCGEYADGERARICRQLEEIRKRDADTVQLFIPLSLCEDAVPVEINLSQDEEGDYTFTDFSETWEMAGAGEERFASVAEKYGVGIGKDHELYLPTDRESIIGDSLRFAFCVDEIIGG